MQRSILTYLQKKCKQIAIFNLVQTFRRWKKAALTVASALQQSDVKNCPLCKKQKTKKQHQEKKKTILKKIMLVLMYILLFFLCDSFVIGDSQTSRIDS